MDTGHQVGFTSTAAGNMSMTVLAQSETVQNIANNRREIERKLGISPGTTRFVSQTRHHRLWPVIVDGHNRHNGGRRNYLTRWH